MTQPEAKSVMFHLRVTPGLKQHLTEEASRYGEPSEVIRAVLTAFVEGRVTIIPPKQTKESLYNARTED